MLHIDSTSLKRMTKAALYLEYCIPFGLAYQVAEGYLSSIVFTYCYAFSYFWFFVIYRSYVHTCTVNESFSCWIRLKAWFSSRSCSSDFDLLQLVVHPTTGSKVVVVVVMHRVVRRHSFRFPVRYLLFFSGHASVALEE